MIHRIFSILHNFESAKENITIVRLNCFYFYVFKLYVIHYNDQYFTQF